MKIVSPASRLFEKNKLALEIYQLSDSVEARPDLGVLIPSFMEVSHCHVSHPAFDLNMPWSDSKKNELFRILSSFDDNPPTISFHLARDCLKVKLDSLGRYVPKSPALTSNELLDNCVTNVSWLKTELGFPIIVENNNYYRTGAYDVSTSPSFIRRVVDTCEIGLLFDVAHAAVSAHNLGISLEQYLEALPLEKTQQIHVSRHKITEGEAFDAHDLPDLNLIRFSLGLIEEKSRLSLPVTIEHYRNGLELIGLLTELGKDRIANS